ncbi:unnamed protein product, partial [Didymodactylos carnosus]
DDGKEKPQQLATSSPCPLIETKIFYYIDDQEPPYLTKLCQQHPVKLKDFKNALDRNCSNHKFFFMASDNTIGKVKEEIINDDQILPYADNSTDRILAYLVSIEGSTTSGDDRSSKVSKWKKADELKTQVAPMMAWFLPPPMYSGGYFPLFSNKGPRGMMPRVSPFLPPPPPITGFQQSGSSSTSSSLRRKGSVQSRLREQVMERDEDVS